MVTSFHHATIWQVMSQLRGLKETKQLIIRTGWKPWIPTWKSQVRIHGFHPVRIISCAGFVFQMLVWPEIGLKIGCMDQPSPLVWSSIELSNAGQTSIWLENSTSICCPTWCSRFLWVLLIIFVCCIYMGSGCACLFHLLLLLLFGIRFSLTSSRHCSRVKYVCVDQWSLIGRFSLCSILELFINSTSCHSCQVVIPFQWQCYVAWRHMASPRIQQNSISYRFGGTNTI